MHHTILAELNDPELTSLETVRKFKSEVQEILTEARAADPSNPWDDYEENENGEILFDGLTLQETEDLMVTLTKIYRSRLRHATGR